MTSLVAVPRVSVIVPAHDAAAHLSQAVASVHGQTYEDWELVIADDASSDQTPELIEGLGPRVTGVRSDVNLGPAGARNLALSRARGELVALLDADDYWLPRYLASQVERFDAERARHADVGLVACDARILEGEAILEHTYLDQFRDVPPLTLERVLKGNCVFVSALVPRSVGDEVGWFSTELFGTEDHDLWIRILERGYRPVLNGEVLAVYRRGGSSVSSNLARMGASNARTYARALARGALSLRQQRIARTELRYSRALELVATAAFDRSQSHRQTLRRLARALPQLAVVVATRPRQWGDWLRVFWKRRSTPRRPRDANGR